ncbi:MAG: hypothetical protein QOE09_1746 [Ilumatobacteraceae bacterium]|jgi:hypothetical protein
MELHWDDYEPTPEERAEVEAWIAANDSPTIGSIAISSEAVFVHGNEEHMSHSAVRSHHHDDISRALTEAAAELRAGL